MTTNEALAVVLAYDTAQEDFLTACDTHGANSAQARNAWGVKMIQRGSLVRLIDAGLQAEKE
jgi:hypothetical protein